MSEQEQIIIRIKRNIQKIDLFKLNSNINNEIVIGHLRKENIKLEELLKKARENNK